MKQANNEKSKGYLKKCKSKRSGWRNPLRLAAEAGNLLRENSMLKQDIFELTLKHTIFQSETEDN